MKILFLLPARGGSKGLPGKNASPLGGIPLIGRTALLAKQALSLPGMEGRVVCSTDDEGIAEAARAWGAEVPFMRPSHLATDEASSMDVILHALDALAEPFDALALLQPTSPLVAIEDLREALDLFKTASAPVVSVCRNEHPIEWSFYLDSVSRMSRAMNAEDVGRRQDAIPTFRPNGAIYIAAPSMLHKKRSFIVPETRGYVMPADRSVDIDSWLDLDLAEAILAGRPVSPVDVAGRKIGDGYPCFVIAEAGVNHNGDMDLAKRLVDAAARSGADAVKFQTFRAGKVVSASAPKAAYQIETTDDAESQLDMVRRLELPYGDFKTLFEHCRERGILFLSTPFDEESADFLESLGVPAFKIPSGEITNLPFLRHVSAKGKPMIVSTGMATMVEVHEAVRAIRSRNQAGLVLLHCVSNYPADPADVNLRAMETLRKAFGVPVGYSDHTRGIEVPLAAAALGATVIEKHFTLDRTLPGPDHKASVEPDELRSMIAGIRKVEAALGKGEKQPVASELETARIARKSLVAARDIPAGTVLTQAMVTAKRPGTGLSPSRIDSLIGRKALVDIPEDTLLTLEMFS